MIWPADLAPFLVAALALNLTPGSDMLFCLGQGMAGGPRQGTAAALGIFTGCAIHTLLAAVGVAALLATHPAAFEAVRWTGVTYLVYVGGTLVNLVVGSMAGGLGQRLAANPGLARAFTRLSSVIFVGLAARLAFDRR